MYASAALEASLDRYQSAVHGCDSYLMLLSWLWRICKALTETQLTVRRSYMTWNAYSVETHVSRCSAQFDFSRYRGAIQWVATSARTYVQDDF